VWSEFSEGSFCVVEKSTTKNTKNKIEFQLQQPYLLLPSGSGIFFHFIWVK
jgi:hypothetical protein